MNRLFVLGSFTDDPQSILAAVHRLALMGVKLCPDFGFGIRAKLRVAPFAHAKNLRSLFYDPEAAFRHDCSLAHLAYAGESL
jgi:hypothetical protein